MRNRQNTIPGMMISHKSPRFGSKKDRAQSLVWGSDSRCCRKNEILVCLGGGVG